jgi:prepilin-type N-terminal cleavage/methylation domain-containing protein
VARLTRLVRTLGGRAPGESFGAPVRRRGDRAFTIVGESFGAPVRRRGDRGFTLVEVVVALVLLSAIMSALAVQFVGGVKHMSALQRRQAAVQVAAQALEAVRAASAVPGANGCVKLLQGRSQAAADAQWAGAPADLTAITDEVWTSNLCTGPIVLPWQGLPGAAGATTDPVVVGGQPYTVQTYIGTCVLTAARSSCLRSSAVPGGGPVLHRVLVEVDWDGTGCSAGMCSYTASTLIDTSADPTYNVRGAAAPVAVADSICLPGGGAGTIDVVGNDTGSLGQNPVTIVAPPHKGGLAPSITSGVGGYTRSSGASGTDSFTYYLTDVNGQISSTVTVTLTLGGC